MCMVPYALHVPCPQAPLSSMISEVCGQVQLCVEGATAAAGLLGPERDTLCLCIKLAQVHRALATGEQRLTSGLQSCQPSCSMLAAAGVAHAGLIHGHDWHVQVSSVMTAPQGVLYSSKAQLLR